MSISGLLKDPNQVITTARGLIGTPYKFQGRVPGIGCDCIGLIILVAWQLRLFEFDFKDYGQNPGLILEREVKKYCQSLPNLTKGALAIFEIAGSPRHCGIISHYRDDWGLIHAYQNVGRVREHKLIKWWQDKLVGIYELPNVNYY